MSENAAALLSQALSLPNDERETFAAQLWDSLDLENGLSPIDDPELLRETAHRLEELKSGKVTGLSHEELKSSLGR